MCACIAHCVHAFAHCVTDGGLGGGYWYSVSGGGMSSVALAPCADAEAALLGGGQRAGKGLIKGDTIW